MARRVVAFVRHVFLQIDCFLAVCLICRRLLSLALFDGIDGLKHVNE